MAHVIVYTKSYCPFSKECKTFLEEKKVEFDEKIVDQDPALEQEMERKTNRRTDTPHVFINGHHMGTFDDLKALDASGKLDEMLDIK